MQTTSRKRRRCLTNLHPVWVNLTGSLEAVHRRQGAVWHARPFPVAARPHDPKVLQLESGVGRTRSESMTSLEMTEELFAIEDNAAAQVEIIGFESAAMPEPASVSCENSQTELPEPAKPRHRRAAKQRKHTHPVRVVFDDREFLKLNSRAGVVGVSVPEYVRDRALRDPRARNRQAASAGGDLFAPSHPAESKFSRNLARLSPEIEERINAYFSPENRVNSDRPRTKPKIGDAAGRPKIFAKLGHFLTELVGSRTLGHHAAPNEGT
jgi:hypothetical protein